MKLKAQKKKLQKHPTQTHFISTTATFISKNTIVIAVTSSLSSSAAFPFANITASPQHSRKGGKTWSNTLQASSNERTKIEKPRENFAKTSNTTSFHSHHRNHINKNRIKFEKTSSLISSSTSARAARHRAASHL